MNEDDDLNNYIQIKLQRDEAIVLQLFLDRELEAGSLKALFAHPAEELAVEGLSHELIPHLIETGGPDGDALIKAAIEHLMARFQ